MNPNMTAGKTAKEQSMYALGFDAGYSLGYKCGLEDGWARGFDAATEEVLAR